MLLTAVVLQQKDTDQNQPKEETQRVRPGRGPNKKIQPSSPRESWRCYSLPAMMCDSAQVPRAPTRAVTGAGFWSLAPPGELA